jgi:tetratricopeptide (TPR) repeat protein
MAAMVLGIVLVSYWPALQGGLVWDDAAHVTRPDLQSWSGLGKIWWELGATQQYYPVLHSAFWIEHRLWGDATVGYHVCNLLFHAVSCCLLALALRRLINWGTGQDLEIRPVALRHAEWLAAVIFAVHPVCVESVAWISEQKNTLSLVFYLLAGHAYLDFHEKRKKRSYFFGLFWFGLALGTKSVTATLPAALLVVLWWREGRILWRRDCMPLLPWLALGTGAGLFTAWVERTFIGAEGGNFDLTFVERGLLAGRLVWFYLGKLIWPVDLMFVYPRWNVETAADGWLGYFWAAGSLTIILWLIRKRSRGPLAGWLFFIGSLFPALGFFNVYPFLFSYAADHFQYLAALGIVTVFACGIVHYLGLIPSRGRSIVWGLMIALIVWFGLLTHRQSRAYVDASTLYRVTLAANPQCWMAHNNLAVELAKSPVGVPEAIKHYEEALRLRPNYTEAHNNLGVELGKFPDRRSEAEAQFERALQLQPNYGEAHCNLANLLAAIPGRMPEAMAQYADALRLEPRLAVVHYSFANTLAKLPDRHPEAVAEYKDALRLKPDYVEAMMNLAIELAKWPSERDEALKYYEAALRTNPKLAEVHYNLAVLLATWPTRINEAIDHFQEALRLEPKYAKAHNNLAALYAQRGLLKEARSHWEKALELDPTYEDARRNIELLNRMQIHARE